MAEIPNFDRALVQREKIVDYLLASDHPEGGSKARLFTSLGFSRDEWKQFAEALIAQAADAEVSAVERKDGVRYLAEGALTCPDGRLVLIRTVWYIDVGAENPRLISAYPLRPRG